MRDVLTEMPRNLFAETNAGWKAQITCAYIRTYIHLCIFGYNIWLIAQTIQ